MLMMFRCVVAVAVGLVALAACSETSPTSSGSDPGDAGDDDEMEAGDEVDASTRADADSGKKDANATDSAIDSGPFDYCTAQAAKTAKCSPGQTFDAAQCAKVETCYRSIYHPDIKLDAYLQCTSASCSGGGTSCLNNLTGHEKDAAFTDFLTSCKTKRDSCGPLGTKQFEDACSPFVVMGLLDAVLTERAACLTKPCTEIRDCMDQQIPKRCGL